MGRPQIRTEVAVFPCSAPRDDYPLIVEVEHGKLLPTATKLDAGEQKEIVRWDHDKIAEAYKDDTVRTSFLE